MWWSKNTCFSGGEAHVNDGSISIDFHVFFHSCHLSSRMLVGGHTVTYLLPGQTVSLIRTVSTHVFIILVRAQSFKCTSGSLMLPSCLPRSFLSVCGYFIEFSSSAEDIHSFVYNGNNVTLKWRNWFNRKHSTPDGGEFPTNGCGGHIIEPCFSQRQDLL